MKWQLLLLFLAPLVVCLQAFDLEKIEPEKNAGMIWLGHNNPDCDSIASAFGSAALYGGKVYISGKVNNEVMFLLKQAGRTLPDQAGDLSKVKIGLVDHNQRLQSAVTVANDNVVCIIDHHPLQGDTFTPPQPISADFRPWTATAAIVADRYLKSGRTPDRGTALLLLGGILSDTLNLTDNDMSEREHAIVKELAAIAGVPDVKVFGRQMLEAKSDYSGLSAEEVIFGDYKEYNIGGKKLGFGLAETLFPEPLKLRADEIKKQLAMIKKERKLDYLFWAIKDISAKRSFVLCVEPGEKALAEKAYRKYLVENNGDWLTLSKTSRKKVLIPAIESAL